MRNVIAAFLCLLSTGALAQSNPGWSYGTVPTPAQWAAAFSSKQDVLNFVPLNVAGGVMSGRLVTAPPSAAVAGFNLTCGSVPASPVNGDQWCTTSGMFVQINGATIGPLAGAGSSTFQATTPITVSFPSAGVVNYACATCGVTGSPLSQFAATTSAQLRGVLSDETGTGAAVFQNGALGAATGTSLALGGATLGSNALAVTGTFAFSAGGSFGGALTGISTLSMSGQLTSTLPIGTAPFSVVSTTNVPNLNASSLNGATFANPGAIGGGTAAAGAFTTLTSGAHTITSAAATALAVGLNGATNPAFVVNDSTALQAAGLSVTGAATGGTVAIAAIDSGSNTNLSIAAKGTGTISFGSAFSGTIAGTPAYTGANFITLANLVQSTSGAQFLGVTGSSAANYAPFTLASLVNLASPSATLDLIPIVDHTTGTIKNVTPGAIASSSVAGVSSLNTATGALTLLTEPMGRLTLQANTPVMTTSQSAQTTLRYDAYVGNQVPYFNGTADVIDTIASNEVTDAMVSAASAGQIVSGQVYDVWWVHGGANRICLGMSASTGGGGGWASDTGGSNTARGTGYSQIDRVTRPYITNKNSITNCFNAATNYGPVSANQGTYLGTVFASANGQISYTFGASASGGTAGLLGVWNMYNRVTVNSTVTDSGANYTYSSATIRQARASAGNQIQFVSGLAEEGVQAAYSFEGFPASVAVATQAVGIGLDTTTAFTSTPFRRSSETTVQAAFSGSVPVNLPAQIGFHTISANEQSDANANTFDGTSLNMLSFSLRM